MSGLAPVHIFSGDRKELEGQNCFCLEPLLNGRSIVVHEEGGNEHPAHEECLARWAQEKADNCPVCQADIDTSKYQSAQKKVKGVVENSWPLVATGVGIQLINTAFSSPYAHAASGLIGTYLVYKNQNQKDRDFLERVAACAIVAVGLGLSVYSGIGLYQSW